MKMLRISLCLLLATLLPRLASADLAGPYTLDTNTTVLLHFDEPSGTTTVTNQGTLGRNFLSTTITGNGAAPVNLLGGAGYATNLPTAISFGGCMMNGLANNSLGFGCDYNNDGILIDSTTVFSDFVPMSALNMGNGASTPWTLEALVQPSVSPLPNQTCCIITADSAGSTTRRALLFRIVASGGVYTINLIGVDVSGTTSLTSSGIIPASGPDALVSNAWYHIAATYDGTNVTIYWTHLDPANGAAHVLSVTPQILGASWGGNSSPLIIGNGGRNGNGAFPGCIDEVRSSKVCRAANQMQFYSPLVTIVQNPAALQNVDYNQPVSFTVAASSLTALGYQWRFNSNGIAGATNSTYTIPNVASFNAGYYDCVVTNTAGYSNLTIEAHLVVGAANFLSHRYSFSTTYIDSTSGLVCTPDSIGSANGTNFGNATISGGQLVLDGSSGTFMQLPGGLYTSASATALTVEFWATFGANANNTWLYLFTSSYNGTGGPPAGFFGFLCNNGSGLPESRGGRSLQVDESVIAPNSLNGVTMHVACTIDPPNKTITIYTNGVLAAINTNAPVAMADVSDTFSFIGCLGSGPGPFLNASINELRIYNGALSPITLTQSDDQGPNVVLASGPVQFAIQPASITVPVGQTATFTAAAVGYLPITYQWFKNGLLVPGATNASYSFQTVIGDNSATFLAHATNTIGVTTYLTNSTTATLTVFLPPTLAWLDAANGGADSLWNTTSLNWTNDINSVVAFAQTNGVIFDSRGSGSPSVDIAQSLIPYNIKVNAASDYTLASSANTGSLDGQGSITKQNSGKLTIDLTNNLSGAVTISGGILQVGNNDGFGTLGNGSVTNNATLSFFRGDTVLNAGNSIHGSGTVSFDGTGAVTLSGVSDYSGSTLINQGIVFLVSSTGLGAVSGGTTIASSGQLYITANVSVAENLTLNGVGDGTGVLRKGGAGLTTDTGIVNLASDSTIGLDTGATLVLSNTVTGTAALTATGGGTLTLSANNTFSGGFTLSGPVVALNAPRALSTGPVTASGAGRFVIGDGLNITNAFTVNSAAPGVGQGLLMVNNNTNGTVTTVSGPIVLNVALANGGVFVGPTSSGFLNVAGTVTMPPATSLTVRGGNVRFSGSSNSYPAIAVAAGTTSLGVNNGVATNARMDVGTSGAAAFDLNGFNQALIGLQNTAPANAAVVTNSSATPATLTLNLDAATYSFSGSIAGNLALKLNSGTQILTGTNAYTGNTTVNGGLLQIAQPTLAANSTVTVTNGAVLQLDFAVTNTVAALVLNGVSKAPGIYDSTTGAPYLTGTGFLQVAIPVATNRTNITAVVKGNKLELSWPADHIGWKLQVQTNSLSTGLGTNWVDVAGASTVNSVTNVINPVNGSVFYRMVYP